MAPHIARENAVHPDSRVGPLTGLELRLHTHNELPDVSGRVRVVHPRQPLPQMLPVTIHHGEDRFRVARLELTHLDAGRHRAAEHPSHAPLRHSVPPGFSGFLDFEIAGVSGVPASMA